jgi:hypothetical protein
MTNLTFGRTLTKVSRSTRVTLLAIALSAGLAIGAATSVASAPEPPATVAGEELPSGLDEVQIKAYMADFPVDRDVAIDNLALMTSASQTMEAVAEAAGAGLSAVRLLHAPRLSIRVVVTSKTDMARLQQALESSPVPYAVEENARFSEDQATGIVSKHTQSWVDKYPVIVGIDTDAASGVVTLDLHGVTEDEAARIVRDLSESSDLGGLNLRSRLIPEKSVASDGRRGGLDMSTTTGSICTLGFSVRTTDGGPWGVATAGHCSNPLRWRWFGDPTWYAATWQDEVRSLNADVQWHTIGPTPLAVYHGPSTTDTYPVDGTMDRSAMLGLYTCHRGQATGWSCGTVVSITYQPTYSGACPSTCLPEWPRAEGATLECYPGDSGGPFAHGFTAQGFYKGQASSGTTAADCDWAIFTPARKVQLMGMSILTQ